MVEQLRFLGYRRLVSMENFRNPNFKLVAELLEWIVSRYDVQISLPLVIDTEQERVLFIKSATFYVLQKARIKLNPKKLYMADGYAVQELAVVVKNLYEITRRPTDLDKSTTLNVMRNIIQNKMDDLQKCRQLASQIPNASATLYDLLAKEVVLRNERSKALSFSLGLSETEKAILQAVQAIQEESAVISRNLQNVTSDEEALDAKIERRKREYDQQQKRLAKLQSFRPQYMDEYEKIEAKLKQLYAVYVLKFRNLAFLQQLQNEFDRAEKQRTANAEQNMRNMVERMRAQELMLREAQMVRLDEEETAERPQVKGSKVFGNMIGAGISDEEEEEELGNDTFDEDEDVDEDYVTPYRNQMEGPRTERGDESDKKLEVSSEDDF